MVEATSQKQKTRQDPITVDKTVMFAYSTIVHDSCWKLKRDNQTGPGNVTVAQAVGNYIPRVHEEIDEIVETFARFGVSDEVYRLKDVDKQELNTKRVDTKKLIQQSPDQ